MKTVIIHLAFAFECPDCGQQTFVESVIREFNEEDKPDAEEDLGEVPRTGDWVTHPETVMCGSCGEEFRALNQGESE